MASRSARNGPYPENLNPLPAVFAFFSHAGLLRFDTEHSILFVANFQRTAVEAEPDTFLDRIMELFRAARHLDLITPDTFGSIADCRSDAIHGRISTAANHHPFPLHQIEWISRFPKSCRCSSVR